MAGVSVEPGVGRLCRLLRRRLLTSHHQERAARDDGASVWPAGFFRLPVRALLLPNQCCWPAALPSSSSVHRSSAALLAMADNGQHLHPSQGNALVYSTLVGFMFVGLFAGWHVSRKDFISGVRTQSSASSVPAPPGAWRARVWAQHAR